MKPYFKEKSKSQVHPPSPTSTTSPGLRFPFPHLDPVLSLEAQLFSRDYFFQVNKPARIFSIGAYGQ